MPALAEQQIWAARSCGASTTWAFRLVPRTKQQQFQQRKCVLRCEAAATQQSTSTGVLQLAHPSGRDVHVFGVEHLKAQVRTPDSHPKICTPDTVQLPDARAGD